MYYCRSRIYRISADCEIYPTYPKSDIRENYCFALSGAKNFIRYIRLSYINESDISEFYCTVAVRYIGSLCTQADHNMYPIYPKSEVFCFVLLEAKNLSDLSDIIEFDISDFYCSLLAEHRSTIGHSENPCSKFFAFTAISVSFFVPNSTQFVISDCVENIIVLYYVISH